MQLLQNCSVITERSFTINIRMQFLHTSLSRNHAKPYYIKEKSLQHPSDTGLGDLTSRIFFNILQENTTNSNKAVRSHTSLKQTLISNRKLL